MIKHGMIKTRFYNIWIKMKVRCLNPNDKDYKHYGKRGVVVCERWLDFMNFQDDMYKSYLKHVKEFGEKNTLIERKNNNSNYALFNCRWATLKEQARNKRTNHLITYKGQTKCKAEWAEELDINYSTLNARINKHNWSIEKTFTTPVRKRNINLSS